jgi:acyl dehydratase
MITLESLEALIGRPFPSGSFTISEYEHWLCADAVLSPELPEGSAHPMYAYYTAVTGMGVSLDELFAMVGSSAADGPMFGEAELEFRKPLTVGATYRVEGGITAVARKEGKRAGVFDIVSFELRVIDDGGAVAAVSTNSFVFPRREG